ncbi:MAG TPA: hypothetical protein VE010_01635 [Thermoanaerobaculia bacterium]|nr:hypothetical protein [Thermoanaerobaculia bacterium]
MIRIFAAVLFLFAFSETASAANLTTGPVTKNNDASCDISVAPAATLLLPYFEVSDSRLGPTTLFTVTNVTNVEQIARVTLWTDFAYPVLSFDIYLTGYDVQSIDLFDVIMRGVISGERGTGTSVSPEGEHAERNGWLQRDNCGAVPAQLAPAVLARIQDALIEGTLADCKDVGTAHENATGYATIDVVRNCMPGRGPADPLYWTEDILFDNVLIGDYAFADTMQNYASATPMVHIRAIPDGGTLQSREALPSSRKPLQQTFYGRFQHPDRPLADGRQPLPSTFATRWINGGPGDFETSLIVWRETVTGAASDCGDYVDNFSSMAESVVFDEDENGEGSAVCNIHFCEYLRLPAASRTPLPDPNRFPQATFTETRAGWIYLNLDEFPLLNARRRQAWVVSAMRAERRFSVSFDAAYLGNGCSPAVPLTEYSEGGIGALPGPAPDTTP